MESNTTHNRQGSHLNYCMDKRHKKGSGSEK